jgi:hypothetical protein
VTRRPSRALVLALLVLCALALTSCGDTLQDQPIGSAPLEAVIVKSRFPVYWLGLGFEGLRVTSVAEDPGGAVTIHYGDCIVGGQYTCVTPLSIVSSPDNSFVPGGAATAHAVRVRGVAARTTQGNPATRSARLGAAGATLAIPTGGVVVSIYAERPLLARDAARMMAPVNEVGLPEMGLPRVAPDTGFDRVPLQSQVPAGVSTPQTHGEGPE